MADFDVLIIGGGPAGYAAALKAAESGAGVALVESEKLGGACVHFACIPTNIMLSAAATFVESRELSVMGVFEAGETFHFGRAVARKDALVRKLADGIGTALEMRGVTLVRGRAAFAGPDRVEILGSDGPATLMAEAFIIATGTRWEPPALPGIATERVLTADALLSRPEAPASTLVLGGGPADTAFALELAFLLAVAGSAVTLAEPSLRLLPALDAAVAAVTGPVLEAAGVTVLAGASVEGGAGDAVMVRHAGGITPVAADAVLAADVRRPYYETLNLAAAGVTADGRIPVDRGCRTNVPHIFSAGDVTGVAMLSNAATHMGEVAGVNAAGGEAVTRLRAVPHLLHTVPEIGWIGMTEDAARAAGYDVRCGTFELGYNARALALGNREGLVKVVAERELGEILGVHVAGPGAAEILAAAATAMQAEVTVQDLAATVHWHPSIVEALSEAARRTL